MRTKRRYVILNSNDIEHVKWSQVCEINDYQCRWSNTREKILLSYRGQAPLFLAKCQGYRFIDKLSLRILTSTSLGWCNIEEEIN